MLTNFFCFFNHSIRRQRISCLTIRISITCNKLPSCFPRISYRQIPLITHRTFCQSVFYSLLFPQIKIRLQKFFPNFLLILPKIFRNIHNRFFRFLNYFIFSFNLFRLSLYPNQLLHLSLKFSCKFLINNNRRIFFQSIN